MKRTREQEVKQGLKIFGLRLQKGPMEYSDEWGYQLADAKTGRVVMGHGYDFDLEDVAALLQYLKGRLFETRKDDTNVKL